MSDARGYTERRKKVVRFDGYSGLGLSELETQSSLDSQTRDSGIDVGSSLTSSEDSQKADSPKVQQHVHCALVPSRQRSVYSYESFIF